METLNLHPEIQIEFTQNGTTHRRRIIAWSDDGDPLVVSDDGNLTLARTIVATRSRVVGHRVASKGDDQ